MQMFFEAVKQQALCRSGGIVPDFDTYVEMRRETSGCKPVFDLIEYSLDLELPDAVVEHPVIVALNDGANDLVTWSNVSARLVAIADPHLPVAYKERPQDLFSYNVEQSRGDTHNMVCVFMNNDGLGLQQAVDRVGGLCKQAIDTFIENQARVPSWGDDIDKDVKLYVNGLQEWIAGSLHWSFMTTRYFGNNGGEVKATRMVELLSHEITKA
jgi:alpha-muurolene/germacrene-A/gamma-muurolene synthase